MKFKMLKSSPMFSGLAWTSWPSNSLFLMFKSAQNGFTSALESATCTSISQVDSLSGYWNHWGWWPFLALDTRQGQWTHATQVLARRRSAQVNKKCITHLEPPAINFCCLDANCSQIIATITFGVLVAHQATSVEGANLPLRHHGVSFWLCRQFSQKWIVLCTRLNRWIRERYGEVIKYLTNL